MRLHSHAPSANCLKVRVLLAVLGVEHEVVEVDIFDGDTLTDAFGRLNPVRETPVLELDDGTAIPQSNAILTYLAEGTPWAGADRTERGLVASWLAFEQERVMAGIGSVRFRLITGRPFPQRAERQATGRAALDVLEAHLGERDWLVGAAPTIADVGVWAYAHLADEADLPLADWPAVAAWCAHFEALDGVVDDLAPYAPNARPGTGRSIYG